MLRKLVCITLEQEQMVRLCVFGCVVGFFVCLFMVFNATCHFQQYFSYIMAVSFIDGENLSTREKPLIYHKSLTNFIT
jgi:hypothetical protein